MHFESLFKISATTQTNNLTDCKKYSLIFDDKQLLWQHFKLVNVMVLYKY